MSLQTKIQGCKASAKEVQKEMENHATQTQEALAQLQALVNRPDDSQPGPAQMSMAVANMDHLVTAHNIQLTSYQSIMSKVTILLGKINGLPEL